MTYDIDAIIKSSGAMKDAINKVVMYTLKSSIMYL